MKIAIASEKENEKAKVCPTAGRTPYYLIFQDKKFVKTIKNPFAVGGGGAGLGVVQMLNNEGVEMVISGKFGPNMISALEEKGMKYKEMQDITVKEVLEEFIKWDYWYL